MYDCNHHTLQNIKRVHMETTYDCNHHTLQNIGNKECDVNVNHQEINELLNSIRVKNINNIIVAYLNINTFKNNYDFLKTLVSENIDVMIIGETKLDDSFPMSQFFIEGFAEPFRLHRDKNGGDILFEISSLVRR